MRPAAASVAMGPCGCCDQPVPAGDDSIGGYDISRMHGLGMIVCAVVLFMRKAAAPNGSSHGFHPGRFSHLVDWVAFAGLRFGHGLRALPAVFVPLDHIREPRVPSVSGLPGFSVLARVN